MAAATWGTFQKPGTDLLHHLLQVLSVLPEAVLHPVQHLGVEPPVAGQGQVVF